MRPIRNETEYEQALARVNELWGNHLDRAQADELDALAEAIEAYESIELDQVLPPAQPGPLIAYKLRELGMSQNELARQSGLSSGRISEIINGRRGMTLDHVRRISSVLGLDPGVLVHDTSPAPERSTRVAIDTRLINTARALGWLDHPSLESLVNAALSNVLLAATSELAVAGSAQDSQLIAMPEPGPRRDVNDSFQTLCAA